MLDIIKKRFSVREYTNQKISDQDLNSILEAVRLAPTWKNKQCFEVIVINDRDTIVKIGALSKYNPSQSAYQNASHLLFFVADPTKSGLRDDKPYYMCDTAIAMEHAVLQATSLQIGSCWIGAISEAEMKELLQIPDHLKIVGFLTLGYANEEHKIRPRRTLDEFIHYNQYKK